MENFSENTFDFAIIGGGYTGISTAVELIDRGYKVTLIEKSNSIGGLGKTVSLSNGFNCEAYYHHFFTHDNHLINYCKRFLSKRPNFKHSSMSIFYKGKFHSWNGLLDLLKYPHIGILDKSRFIIATLLLSKGLLRKNYLDKTSLDKGLKELYGLKAFFSIWRPMLKGKFGNKSENIPLRWMAGRLKQRIKSRRKGRETLGFIEGSLDLLTNNIKQFILSKNSTIKCGRTIKSIEKNLIKKNYILRLNHLLSSQNEIIIANNLIFTTSAKTNNYLLKDIIPKKNLFNLHKYFTAYCVLIEMNQSLTDFYWTNIADDDLFFCGYIEQTNLTQEGEYGDLHVAYLTKYLFLEESEKPLKNEDLEKKALTTLKKLFPEKDIEKIVINLYSSISSEAQVFTDFKFKESKMELLKDKNIFVGNMSNVYPDERSINNAIKVGKSITEKIN